MIVPAIPKEGFTIGDFAVTKCILNSVASYRMIKKIKKTNVADNEEEQKFYYPLIVIEGAVVGIFSGLVGGV